MNQPAAPCRPAADCSSRSQSCRGCGPQARSPDVPQPELRSCCFPIRTTAQSAVPCVSNPRGTVELAAARESTTVTPNQPPAPVTVMSEADVQRLFGDALSALPPAPQHFTLYFRFESDELTDESRALVPADSAGRQGSPGAGRRRRRAHRYHRHAAGNFELGLRRADAIRAPAGRGRPRPALIEVRSHGEADLLVKTADDVSEPATAASKSP